MKAFLKNSQNKKSKLQNILSSKRKIYIISDFLQKREVNFFVMRVIEKYRRESEYKDCNFWKPALMTFLATKGFFSLILEWKIVAFLRLLDRREKIYRRVRG